MTYEQVLDRVRATIAELFELDVAQVRAESTVFEDLDLDSIDAIDLVAKLQSFCGQRIEEASMREVRTVADLAALVHSLMAPARPKADAG